MNNGRAWAIFKKIDSDEYTDEEKGFAIRMVMDMETINSITKEDMRKVTKWLWNRCFVWEGDGE